jgi:hypothetical protein
MVTFFINCRRRPHARIVGERAFYDLNRHGRQATMATNLRPGEECVVATPERSSDVVFGWFAFTDERVMPDEHGVGVRVLFGKWLRSVTLTRAQAIVTEPYAVFFNVNGHFKRPSVIQPRRRRPRALTLQGG